MNVRRPAQKSNPFLDIDPLVEASHARRGKTSRAKEQDEKIAAELARAGFTRGRESGCRGTWTCPRGYTWTWTAEPETDPSVLDADNFVRIERGEHKVDAAKSPKCKNDDRLLFAVPASRHDYRRSEICLSVEREHYGDTRPDCSTEAGRKFLRARSAFKCGEISLEAFNAALADWAKGRIHYRPGTSRHTRWEREKAHAARAAEYTRKALNDCNEYTLHLTVEAPDGEEIVSNYLGRVDCDDSWKAGAWDYVLEDMVCSALWEVDSHESKRRAVLATIGEAE